MLGIKIVPPRLRDMIYFGFRAPHRMTIRGTTPNTSIILGDREILYATLDGKTEEGVNIDLRTLILFGRLEPLFPGVRRLIVGQWEVVSRGPHVGVSSSLKESSEDISPRKSSHPLQSISTQIDNSLRVDFPL